MKRMTFVTFVAIVVMVSAFTCTSMFRKPQLKELEESHNVWQTQAQKPIEEKTFYTLEPQTEPQTESEVVEESETTTMVTTTTTTTKPLPKISWNGTKLTASRGTVYGPSGKETYYNLPMQGVISIMRGIGNNDPYWVRSDGVKMLGDYIIVAANLKLRPRGTLVATSLGMGIVCDTGGFAEYNPTQLDIAVTW